MSVSRYIAIALPLVLLISSATPSPAADQTHDDAADCAREIRTTARRAARGLYDALARHRFRFRRVELEGDIEVSRQSARPVTFDVVRERGGRAVALVDPELRHRTTFAAVATRAGPIVAWLAWPHPDEIETGTPCEPTSSRVEHPDVPWPTVGAKPLEWWGLRVLWRIPPSFNSGPTTRRATIRSIVEEMYDD